MKTPPMTMAASKEDPSITKFTIPISHVEGSNHQSFGGSLHFNKETGQVTITKVVKGSLADQFSIKVGDELISVNNCINCYGLDLFTRFASCTSNLFKQTDPHELTFRLKRQSSVQNENVTTETVSEHCPLLLLSHLQSYMTDVLTWYHPLLVFCVCIPKSSNTHHMSMLKPSSHSSLH